MAAVAGTATATAAGAACGKIDDSTSSEDYEHVWDKPITCLAEVVGEANEKKTVRKKTKKNY